jgi:hypothetical protein
LDQIDLYIFYPNISWKSMIKSPKAEKCSSELTTLGWNYRQEVTVKIMEIIDTSDPTSELPIKGLWLTFAQTDLTWGGGGLTAPPSFLPCAQTLYSTQNQDFQGPKWQRGTEYFLISVSLGQGGGAV